MKAQAIFHPWNLTEKQAIALQSELADKIILDDDFFDIQRIAGVDVAYDKNSNKLVAAAVVIDAKTHEIIEQSSAKDVAKFPYVSGLFSFRELPPIIDALNKLQTTPDLIVCDGQGIAHPRRFGLACHLGIIFDIPTIGCAKTCLIGEYSEPNKTSGSSTPLIDNGEVIGTVLRTQENVKPVYVSCGHRISLKTASEWILKLSPRYRLPETTRLADQNVKKLLNIRA